MRFASSTHCLSVSALLDGVGELLGLGPHVAIEARHRGHQFLGCEAAAVAIGDRAARGDEPHAGTGVVSWCRCRLARGRRQGDGLRRYRLGQQPQRQKNERK